MKMAAPQSQIKVISTFIFIFSGILSVAICIADDGDDTLYMSQLLNALTPTPLSWSNNTHFCKWSGIVCNQSTSRVQSIILPSSSLTGTIPSIPEADFSSLNNLTLIDLHNNSLTGPVPLLARFRGLETVLLGDNNFTSLQHSWYRGGQLRTLNLTNNLNLIPWLFPSDWVESPLLHTLDLQATNIIGSMPSSMFDWFPKLETVVLSYNNISGDLPESLGRSAIRNLKLDNQGFWNQITGTIDVISSMTLLSQAWLHENTLSGPIPDLSNCTHLFDLQLHSNNFFGMVPPSLMGLSSLKSVSLDDNYFQGPIPVFGKGVRASWGGMNGFCDERPCDPQLPTLLVIAEAFLYPNILMLHGWTGSYPCDDGVGYSDIACTNGTITSIDFSGRNLNGTISPTFANLTGLVNLNLSANNLTGSIPQILTTLPLLQLLDLSNNILLSGQIPNFSSNVKLNTTGNLLLGRKTNDTTTGSPSKTPNAASLRPIWIAGSLAFSVGVAILVLIICKYKRYLGLVQKRIFMKTRKDLEDNVEDFIKTYNLSVPKRYSYAEVKTMTNSFRDKLGQGGYGVVYKASLPDGRQVAVKLINESKGDGEEFINEVASISRTSHVNIVSLLGFCYEKNKRALIYEFMINGSLDRFIYRRGFPTAICSLDWNALYQIVVGIARGLEYLHQGCISRILHLDIKPQNILLDEDFCPKISDFGLAKICQKKDSIVSIVGTRGTIGFIAPEVFSRAYGGVSHKSDVYSYGMLVLEMIGGKKNYDTGGSCSSEMYFPDWIYKDLELSHNLENCLGTSEEENDMVRTITMVSLWCIQTNRLNRPSMSKVIEMLQGPLQDIPYPPKPVLYSPKRASLEFSCMSSDNLSETNSITLHEDDP